jgi:hypothetical protein
MSRSGERGLALVLTAVLGIIAMALWILTYRTTMDGIRAETRVIDREARDTTVTRALAAALALLRTGPPSATDVSYLFTVVNGAETTICTVTYTNTGGDAWDVDARIATEDDIDTFDDAPPDFAPE